MWEYHTKVRLFFTKLGIIRLKLYILNFNSIRNFIIITHTQNKDETKNGIPTYNSNTSTFYLYFNFDQLSVSIPEYNHT